MPRVQLATRNVFIYDGTTDTVVGGCRQFGTTSIAEFCLCLRLFIVSPVDFQLYHHDTGDYVTQNDHGHIQTGDFVISSTYMTFVPMSLMPYSRARDLLGVDTHYWV